MRVMQLLHTVLMKKIHITKRDLFYTDVKLFVDQADSDGVLDDIATMIGCTRSKYVLLSKFICCNNSGHLNFHCY